MLETLEWAADNEIDIQLTYETGLLVFTAINRNISAQSPVEGSSAESVGNALLTALLSVKAGTEFHARHGFMPSIGKRMHGE